MPPTTVVVLGLVSTKFGALERRDDLLRRIDEASAYHPVEALAISPQRGFASTAPGNLLSADEVWGGATTATRRRPDARTTAVRPAPGEVTR